MYARVMYGYFIEALLTLDMQVALPSPHSTPMENRSVRIDLTELYLRISDIAWSTVVEDI